VFVPFQPFHVELTVELAIPLLWLAIVISVIAQLLLYRLLRAGNLVNVTSLFYLVPIGTAILDRVVLGNRLSGASVAGMIAILAGLALVFKHPAPETISGTITGVGARRRAQ
jgi:drug/metabolite transporter (DMT)-like permease